VKRILGTLALAGLACGGGGECDATVRTGGDLTVTVTSEDGCDGATWRADVAFLDGRTQVLAGDRDGAVLGVVIGDFAGDSLADVVVVVEPRRVFGFVRLGGILFGRELPSPPGQGPVTIRGGRLFAGSPAWDAARDVWAQPE